LAKEDFKNNIIFLYLIQWAKSPKKQSVRVIFDNMALNFDCRINKTRTLSDCFFGDFGHWDGLA